MRQQILLLILVGLLIECSAQPTKDISKLARENNTETVKRYCVDYWTADPVKRDLLAKFSSVAETCSCIDDEMKFTVSDDLALRLLQFQSDKNSASATKYLTEEVSDKTAKEWFERYFAATASCGQRFIRRTNQR